eukprot:768646-Hanusia_phi.AAC.1
MEGAGTRASKELLRVPRISSISSRCGQEEERRYDKCRQLLFGPKRAWEKVSDALNGWVDEKAGAESFRRRRREQQGGGRSAFVEDSLTLPRPP